jgi:flagellar motor protein MotB
MQHRSSQTGSVVWYISFGDLLTLLLCFFLVLTPWDKLRAAGNAKAKQEVGSAYPASRELGTVLAYSSPQGQSPILAELPIYAEHVNGESLSGLISLVNALQQEVAPYMSDIHSLTVTVCDPHVDRLRVLAEVGRLTRELGGERTEVGVEVASDCNRIEILRPTTGKVVGVISMRGV